MHRAKGHGVFDWQVCTGKVDSLAVVAVYSAKLARRAESHTLCLRRLHEIEVAGIGLLPPAMPSTYGRRDEAVNARDGLIKINRSLHARRCDPERTMNNEISRCAAPDWFEELHDWRRRKDILNSSPSTESGRESMTCAREDQQYECPVAGRGCCGSQPAGTQVAGQQRRDSVGGIVHGRGTGVVHGRASSYPA